MKLLSRLLAGPIARGTIRTTFVLGLRLIVQAGTLLIVARMLGPGEFGAFAGIASLAVILGTLSTFGTQTVLLGEVAKGWSRRGRVLPYAIPTTLMTGIVLLVIYLLACRQLLARADVAMPVLLAIGATETLLQPLYALMRSEHHGLRRIARSQLMQLLPLVLRLATAIVVLSLGIQDALAAYATGYFAASAIALAYGVAALPAPWPAMRRWRLPTWPELVDAVGYAATSVTQTGPTELDKTLATRLLPLGSAGVYAAAARVIGAATLPITAMTLSSLPRLFREGGSRGQRTRHLLGWMFSAAGAFGLAIAVILWLATPVFGWIFGDRYHGINQMIPWLCLAVPGMSMRLVAGNVLVALGQPWVRVGFEVTGLVVLVATSVVLTARFGAIGMPLALACSEWAMMAVSGAGVITWLLRASDGSGPGNAGTAST